MIMKPDIGKNSRVSETASARDSPLKPAPKIVVSAGANAIPINASAAAATNKRPSIAPARARPAFSSRSLSAAYTGMKDADSVPSLSRLRIVLARRCPTLSASAAQPLPM